ncbi:MAG: membrane protein insertase YidC [Bacteroidales bacterium]
MNKDTIIGFVLIAAILIGYSFWMSPSKEEVAIMKQKQDSIERLREQNRILDSVNMLARAQEQLSLPENRPLDTVSNSYQALRDKFGAFASSSEGETTSYTIENDLLKLSIPAKGGYISSVELSKYKTWDSLALVLFDPASSNFDVSFFSQNRSINTKDFYFKPFLNGKPYTGGSLTTPTNDSLVFGMRLFADDLSGNPDPSKYIEFEYRLRPGEYMLGFDINIKGMSDVMASNTSFLALNWNADLLKQEKSVDNFNGSTIYYKHHNDDVEYMSETKDEELSVKTRVKWVSFKQRFFTSTLISTSAFDNADMKTVTQLDNRNPRYLKSMETTVELPFRPEAASNIPLSFYFGPNQFKELKSHHLDLEKQIPLGWSFFLLAWINIYVVIPVFGFLGSYGWNYGIVILVLTILLKILLFPIAYKTYLSSAKMRVLKPEVDEISAKFPKSEDAMKKQQAIMALYKKAGANPMSGCVPMLLQMPILIAMFRFFPSSIELRQQPFLWATDLSSFDSIWNLPFEIPFYGSHVSLFTLLMTISTIIYTYLNNQMMGSQSTQLPGMKTMMYIMPIMFLGMFNNYASGLSYYYFLANVITFAQMYIFRLAINEDKVHAKIQENKKKPVKKSGFQARLEEAAKKRGYQMPK